jgi:RNA polymerase sigma-70 factor (ECF subfamily)
MPPPSEPEDYSRFLRVYTAHEPAIRAFVRRLVPTRADADDIMQDAAVVLWEKFPSMPADADFRSWAFGVARYEVLGWLRDRGRDRLVLDEELVLLMADDAVAAEQQLESQRHALEQCLQKVAPAERDLLMRAYSREAQIQDVAAESGRSVPGFYQWLHRMRRLLLDCVRRTMAREVPL